MAIQLNRDTAFLLVISAAMVFGLSVANVVRNSDGLNLSLETTVVFLGMNGLFAATLAWFGCRRLRELKRACPDESWLKFLRHELIMTVVMVAVMAGVAATPEPWLKAAWDFFHEVELLRMMARGGH